MLAPDLRRGSALLIVLWLLAFLSFLIVTGMMVAMQDVETVSSRQLVFRARQLAEMGVAIGAHPAVSANDPLLKRTVSDVESYEVNLATEESRLNINAMLTDDHRQVLERLFEGWGLSPPDAQMVVDCLMDWVDPDDFKHLKGAEKDDYAKEGYDDRPYNRPFYSLEEMSLVRGMDLVTQAHPQWRDSFTVWGQGALDINGASADLISAVANVPGGGAASLVASRNGPDGLPQTPDDQPIQSLETALALLGVSGPQAQVVAPLFILKGTVVRVESTGRAGNYSRRVTAVLQKSINASQLLEWRESSPDK